MLTPYLPKNKNQIATLIADKAWVNQKNAPTPKLWGNWSIPRCLLGPVNPNDDVDAAAPNEANQGVSKISVNRLISSIAYF